MTTVLALAALMGLVSGSGVVCLLILIRRDVARLDAQERYRVLRSAMRREWDR
jgi:hypothetical protein